MPNAGKPVPQDHPTLNFADVLRRYRLAAGLTQEGLAERAALSARAISELERGTHQRPQRATVQLLVKALGLSAAEAATLDAAVHRPRPLSGPPAGFQTLGDHRRLTTPLTSFIGRERELAELLRLLQVTRLVTLTGTGGVGKTRLALQVAEAVASAATDGASLVDLSPLSDPALVPHAVAAALSVREEPDRPLVTTLSDALRTSERLVVMDNCEHLIVACAHLVDALLRACPRLRILATSREPLGVDGEVTWPVPPLSLPAPGQPLSREGVLAAEAVRLFVERAVAALPAFAVTEERLPVIARICRQLDGIPLAIELAAAQLRALSVEQIAAHLDDRFRLLVGRSRTAPARHQTLRALVDWSYDLLSSVEQAVLRRLAAFAGGWTLEAAEVVCAGPPVASSDVLLLLAQLVEKSLVVMEERGGGTRYRFLDTIRHYALQQLRDAGEEVPAGSRHAGWMLNLAEQGELEIIGQEQVVWIGLLETELDNLRRALDWSDANEPAAETALRLLGATSRFWEWRGHINEGAARLEHALARGVHSPTSARAKALVGALRLEWRRANLARTRAIGEECVRLCLGTGEQLSQATALRYLGYTAAGLGDQLTARRCAEEGLAVARQAGSQREIAYDLRLLSTAHVWAGELLPARRLADEALSISDSLVDRVNAAMALIHVGLVAVAQEDYADAERFLDQGLAVAEQIGYAVVTGCALVALGYLAETLGDDRTALQRYRDCLRQIHPREDFEYVVAALEASARLAARKGLADQSARLLGAVSALRAGLVSPVLAIFPPTVSAERREESLTLARDRCGVEGFAVAWAEGQAMSLEEAIACALRMPLPA